jgi:ferric-chelate reductase
MEIATVAAMPDSGLDLHVSVFVTCLCNPEAVPPIPNSDVRVERPSIHRMLREFITPPCPPCAEPAKGVSSCCSPAAGPSTNTAVAGKAAAPTPSLEIEEFIVDPECDCETADPTASGLKWVGLGGGVAVCASGPERLTREARNAVARIGMTKSVELGGIALHTELFSL